VACGLRLKAGLQTSAGALDADALCTRLAECRPTPRSPMSLSPTYLSPTPPPVDRAAQRVVHAETYEMPWWALGGLKLREATLNPDWSRRDQPIAALEHRAADQPPLRFPDHSAWSRRRPSKGLVVAVVALLVSALLAGLSLAPPTGPGAADPAALGRWGYGAVCAALSANVQLTLWQLGWLGALNPAEGAPGAQAQVGWALLADLPLIVGYAYLLALGTSWAFAQVARLRHVRSPNRPLLNLLGGAAGLAVVADLIENLATWFTWIHIGPDAVATPAYAFGLLMTLACAAKWLGVLGSGGLIAWGLLARVKGTWRSR
jgi:hypothetical protein